ncbi:MAG: ribose 5-phosphate isomerase A [Phototrophicales bacterium]|nr:MAG: ribose 5-phosphate isomerase A [Phototrophicales bacterium]
MNKTEQLKKQAADYAVELIESNMIIGLGHGSTAIFALRRIAERIHTHELQNIYGIPVSQHVEQEAKKLGIPLTNFEQHPIIDITIDGADEVDPNLNLIKGGGGALLREKIVAQASKRNVIIVDESKLSPSLGTRFFLPIEVIPFGWHSQLRTLTSLGATWELRLQKDGRPFLTDQGNYILDGTFASPPSDVYAIAHVLQNLATVVQHGLFLDLATDVVIASESGIQHKQRS